MDRFSLSKNLFNELISFCDSAIYNIRGSFDPIFLDETDGYPLEICFSEENIKEAVKSVLTLKNRLNATKSIGISEEDIQLIKDVCQEIYDVLNTTRELEMWDNGPSFQIDEANIVIEKSQDIKTNIFSRILKERINNE